MQKSAAAFRTISEVGETLDVPAHVLRFWESKFNQIRPVKRGGGRRYYRPEDVSLIRGIQHLLYEQGMTIKGAQKVLSDKGTKSVTAIGTDLLSNGIQPTNTQLSEQTPTPIVENEDTPIPPEDSPNIQVKSENPEISSDEIRDAMKRLRKMRRRVRRQIRSIE